MTPAKFAQTIRDEIESWKKVREEGRDQARVHDAQAARLHGWRPRSPGRRAGARPVAPDRRQHAHRRARGFRRRGDQGGAGRGRHPARLAHRRHRRPTGSSTRATRRASPSSCAARSRASWCSSSSPSATSSWRASAPTRWRRWAWVPMPCSPPIPSSSWCASPAGARAGPYRRRPGFGTLVEGISGFASFNGFADREPVLPPIYMADSYAGLYGAIGALVALREAEVNGGKGQVIDLPLLDPLFHVLGPAGGELSPHGPGEAAYRQPLDQFRARATPTRRATASTWRCRLRPRRCPSAS